MGTKKKHAIRLQGSIEKVKGKWFNNALERNTHWPNQRRKETKSKNLTKKPNPQK
jgi:hypothetical protein